MSRHVWRKIEYEDDVVPWHCMNCGEWDTDKWDDEDCPNEFTGKSPEPEIPETSRLGGSQ